MLKKKWVTPKLIILIRQEEQLAVLTTCKHSTYWTPLAMLNDHDGDCKYIGARLPCKVCQSSSPS